MTAPILAIVGRSNSGKTTLLEGLITELKRRGRKVAVIKHAGENIELDTMNKDTWRFSRAGSDLSAISAGGKLAMFHVGERDFTPDDIATLAGTDYDIILAEGFKQRPYPKIEVHRKEQGKELVSPPDQLVAIVTDEALEAQAPQFGKEEVGKVVDLIENTLLQPVVNAVDLMVNDEAVVLKPASSDLIARTLLAMVPGTRNIQNLKSIRVSLRRRA
jgi:molybdopterin-guanine dinucleotide biosynthesis protein B